MPKLIVKPVEPPQSEADQLAHDLASYVRRPVLERFPAGDPRGSWPAEDFAAQRRAEGQSAEVVMDLASDSFLVVAEQAERGW